MTPADLLSILAADLDTSVSALRGRSRKRHIVQARQAACWALKAAFPTLSQQSIGEYLGGLDHATVKHAIARVAERLETDAQLRAVLHGLVGYAPQRARRPTAIPRAALYWWGIPTPPAA